MNYNHTYHAGNFADLVKHLVLIACINNLKKKSSPFHVLDCFAGFGLYPLDKAEALVNREFDAGVARLCPDKAMSYPFLLKEYYNVIEKYYAAQNIYPGSPAIINETIREVDRAEFCELNALCFDSLRRNLKIFKNSYSCHKLDGYLSIKSLTPPKEKRGLILLDPPFEVNNEFEKLNEAALSLTKRYSQATIIIWYPIKELSKVSKFYNELKKLSREILKIEFRLDKISTNLKSSGILVINPPNISDLIDESLTFLMKEVYVGELKFIISHLG